MDDDILYLYFVKITDGNTLVAQFYVVDIDRAKANVRARCFCDGIGCVGLMSVVFVEAL